MSQYADDRDVDDEARRDIEEMIAEKRDPMCGPHRPDITIPDRAQLNSDEMGIIRRALISHVMHYEELLKTSPSAVTAAKWGKARVEIQELFEKIANVSRLVEPPF